MVNGVLEPAGLPVGTARVGAEHRGEGIGVSCCLYLSCSPTNIPKVTLDYT